MDLPDLDHTHVDDISTYQEPLTQKLDHFQQLLPWTFQPLSKLASCLFIKGGGVLVSAPSTLGNVDNGETSNSGTKKLGLCYFRPSPRFTLLAHVTLYVFKMLPLKYSIMVLRL